MKPLIILKPFQHRGGEQIGIYFQKNLSLNILIRNKAGGIWSGTGKCWYVSMNRESFEKIKTILKEHAPLEYSELKKYLNEKNNLVKTTTPSKSHPVLPNRENNKIKPVAEVAQANKHVLPEMIKHLQLKGYSSSTLKTYTNEMAVFLKAVKNHAADEFT